MCALEGKAINENDCRNAHWSSVPAFGGCSLAERTPNIGRSSCDRSSRDPTLDTVFGGAFLAKAFLAKDGDEFSDENSALCGFASRTCDGPDADASWMPPDTCTGSATGCFSRGRMRRSGRWCRHGSRSEGKSKALKLQRAAHVTAPPKIAKLGAYGT
jgi:hypothetical protein